MALVVMLVAFVYMERMKKQHDLRHVPRGAGVQPRRAGRARHARGTPASAR
ncbi:MAG: hypothetical protein ACLTSX_07165 [Collinsella sp.]